MTWENVLKGISIRKIENHRGRERAIANVKWTIKIRKNWLNEEGSS